MTQGALASRGRPGSSLELGTKVRTEEGQWGTAHSAPGIVAFAEGMRPGVERPRQPAARLRWCHPLLTFGTRPRG